MAKDDSSDSDATDSSASWEKGTTKAESVCVMGASAARDSNDSLSDSQDCKRLVKKCQSAQKKKKGKKSHE